MNELNPETIRLISSTQVITSICSVVKELVENSLDAQAESIEIKLENDGLAKIEVYDNGTGIGKEDIVRLCSPHFTSKINNEKDLFHLLSYGFRGEALSSMCAVAKVEVITKTKDDQIAHMYNFNQNGSLLSSKPVHNNNGTTVIIRDLFKAFPVRRQIYQNKKMLKNEIKIIEELLMSFSFIHPKIRLILRNNKNLIFEKHRASSIDDVISTLLGKSVLNNFSKISHNAEKFNINGFIPSRTSCPDIVGRAVNDRIFIAVNDRPVKIKEISSLVKEFFKECCKTSGKRFPIAIICLQVDSTLVDVNVEPNKNTVNIEIQGDVIEALTEECKRVYSPNSENNRVLQESVSMETKSMNVNEYDKTEKRHEKHCDNLDILPNGTDDNFHDEDGTVDNNINRKFPDDLQCNKEHIDETISTNSEGHKRLEEGEIVNENNFDFDKICDDNLCNEETLNKKDVFEKEVDKNLLLNNEGNEAINSESNLESGFFPAQILDCECNDLTKSVFDEMQIVQNDEKNLEKSCDVSENVDMQTWTKGKLRNEVTEEMSAPVQILPNVLSNKTPSPPKPGWIDPIDDISTDNLPRENNPHIQLQGESVDIIEKNINTFLKYNETPPPPKVKKRWIEEKLEPRKKKLRSPVTESANTNKFIKTLQRKKIYTHVNWNGIFQNTYSKENLKTQKSDKESYVIGHLHDSSIWIICCCNRLLAIDRIRLSEHLLYRTLIRKHKFEPDLLAKPINLNMSDLGEERYSFLCNQEIEFFNEYNSRFIKLEDLIYNGILMKRRSNVSDDDDENENIQVTHLPKLFPSEISKEHILSLVDNCMQGKGMSTRPHPHDEWCKKEARRLADTSTTEYTKSEVYDLITDNGFNLCDVNDNDSYQEHLPDSFHSIYDLKNITRTATCNN